MSEIKYRVWNVRRWLKETEVAITPDGKILVLDRDEEIWRENVHYDLKIVQCTGLTDRNGKEIYEGDFVKGAHRANEEWVQLQEVKYSKGCFMFGNWNAHEYFNKHTCIEIIGNIFSNPELVTA